MAIVNFVPEVWSAQILMALRPNLIFGSDNFINRDYEGEIANAGDTVHIVSFNDPAVRTYTKNTDITWDLITDVDRVLTVNQSDYIAFTVDDVDRRQALGGFVEAVSFNAAFQLASKTDAYVAALMAAGVDAGNQLGAVAVNTADEAYQLLLNLRAKLNKAYIPQAGRWVTVPTDLVSYMLQDDRFVRSDAAPGTTVQTGLIGRALGFDVYEAQDIPFSGGAYTVLAGHRMATTFAETISKVEALRLQNQFGDGIRGLHLYGGRVVRPTAMASAVVTIS